MMPLSQQLAQRKQGKKVSAAKQLMMAKKEAVTRVQTAAASPIGMPVGSPQRAETAAPAQRGGPQALTAAETEIVKPTS